MSSSFELITTNWGLNPNGKALIAFDIIERGPVDGCSLGTIANHGHWEPTVDGSDAYAKAHNQAVERLRQIREQSPLRRAVDDLVRRGVIVKKDQG